MHCILSQVSKKKNFGDEAQLYHSYRIVIIFVLFSNLFLLNILIFIFD